MRPLHPPTAQSPKPDTTGLVCSLGGYGGVKDLAAEEGEWALPAGCGLVGFVGCCSKPTGNQKSSTASAIFNQTFFGRHQTNKDCHCHRRFHHMHLRQLAMFILIVVRRNSFSLCSQGGLPNCASADQPINPKP